MAIFTGLFASTFGRLLDRRRRLLAAELGVAALMGGLSLFARQVGWRQPPGYSAQPAASRPAHLPPGARTVRNGWILLSTDGVRTWVEVEALICDT